MVEDDVAADVARLPQLLDHHLLLELEMLGLEMGAADEIGDQPDAERQVPASSEAVEAVPSRSVEALRSPPTSSTASLISRAERPPAPLNTICSNRWARPLTRAASWREPVSA